MTKCALARAFALVDRSVVAATGAALVVGAVPTIVHKRRLFNIEEALVAVPLVTLGRKHEVAVATLNRLTALGGAMALALVGKAWRRGFALFGKRRVPKRIATAHIGGETTLFVIGLGIAGLMTARTCLHRKLWLKAARVSGRSVVATGTLAMPWPLGSESERRQVDDMARAAAAAIGHGGLGVSQVIHFDVVARMRIILIQACRLRFHKRARRPTRAIVVTAQAKARSLAIAFGSILLRALANTQKVGGVAARSETGLVATTPRLAQGACGIVAMTLLALGHVYRVVEVGVRGVIKLKWDHTVCCALARR